MSSVLDSGAQALTENSKYPKGIILSNLVRNISAIILSFTSIESLLNEIIVSGAELNEFENQEYYKSIKRLDRKLDIQGKYDLIAITRSIETWDSSREPFQSFEIIKFLRNHIIHFKGEFTGLDYYPKKLKPLLDDLRIIEIEKSWESSLFSHSELAKWVFEKSNSLRDNIMGLLNR